MLEYLARLSSSLPTSQKMHFDSLPSSTSAYSVVDRWSGLVAQLLHGVRLLSTPSVQESQLLHLDICSLKEIPR